MFSNNHEIPHYIIPDYIPEVNDGYTENIVYYL